MKVAVFSTKPYDEEFLRQSNLHYRFDLTFFEEHLTEITAPLAAPYDVICAFVNDELNDRVLHHLFMVGIKLVALRSAGFNNVDLIAAQNLGITVMRVPAYSPHSIAEHTVGLILALNRKIHRAYARVREGNFSLNGLLGFDLYGHTVGIVGTGRIGCLVGKILAGFGCNILAYDIVQNETCLNLGFEYVTLDELFTSSDIISLHCPLTPETRHLINSENINRMKDGVMLINTSRGALIDTPAVIEGLKTQKIAYLGLDVYEEEADLFYQDLSDQLIKDDVFARLLTIPNVIITGHQAFFTKQALKNIADTTLANIFAFANGQESGNEVKPEYVLR
jgi:D-lactate dehydrogenase